MFQFHNGTIKTLEELAEIFSYYKFQFHNGTIKTDTRPQQKHIYTQFQFHNGTIKTRRRWLADKRSYVSIP